ncbi:hypothetical protein [Streptosporangium sp. CA-115845]|uniref:hypothetical protein n=1 Tax=Streptosporangium sp. CA-115845 TaxID=3240071 RepID=UPI003D92943B
MTETAATGYDCLSSCLVPESELRTLDDRHVLAAAIKVGARGIVTSNLRDFPSEHLAPWEIEAKSPDDFVLDQIDLDGRVVWACVQQSLTTW